MITKNQALKLTVGQIIYHKDLVNADGSPLRAKVNGMVKTWKRSPERYEVPIKHGLYDYGYLTDKNADSWTL